MLNPKQLLAETAKFFSLNPERWTRGSLRRGLGDTARFCAVGYMAHRMRQDPDTSKLFRNLNKYDAVGKFLAPLGISDAIIVSKNDNASGPEEVVEFLKEEITNA